MVLSKPSINFSRPGSIKATALGFIAPVIIFRTRECNGGSLNTKDVVWCSNNGVLPNFLPKVILLSDLNFFVSLYIKFRSAQEVIKTELSGKNFTGSVRLKFE